MVQKMGLRPIPLLGLVRPRLMGVAIGLQVEPQGSNQPPFAKGRAVSKADFVAAAVRLYADHLDARDDVAGTVCCADADVAADRYVIISTQAEGEVLHQRTMNRLRADPAAG